jgi:hypothetical protein
MTYRTLGELRSELLARLGMGGMGASGGSNQVAIDSYLKNGQEQLYRMQDWSHLESFEDKVIGIEENLFDFPDACARSRRVLRIEVLDGGEYRCLREGIRTGDWSTMDSLGAPFRFERRKQIMVYPKADKAYTVRIWFIEDLARFTKDSDRASLDDGMIFLHALANAKAHYRQPDAATYQGQLNSMLASLRGEAFAGVYRRNEVPPNEPRPVVVG